jgi:hypothetical protein
MLIGVFGKKYHGKDSVSDYIVKKYGFQKEALAKPLKDATKILFGFTDEQLYTDKKEEVDPYWNIKPRAVLQYFGTEVMRKDINRIMPHINDNFWIDRIIKIYDDSKLYNANANIIVSDCRFINEKNAIKNKNGIIIKVVRPSIETNDTHESEIQIDMINDYDYVIINDGTLNELDKKIDSIMIELQKLAN